MKEHPRVAVVIAAYEAERFLSRAVESALAQTLADIEVVIVDDGSTDGTGSVARGFESRDPRVKVLARTNGGPGAARNEGARASSAPALLFLDADDHLPPTRLQVQVAALERNPGVSVIYGPVQEAPADRDSPPIPFRLETDGELLAESLLEGSDRGIPVHSAMIRRTSFLAVGGFRELRPLVEDHDLWTRMALEGLAFRHEEAPPVTYARTENSRSTRSMEVARGHLPILEMLASRLDGTDPARRAAVRRKVRYRTLSLAAGLAAEGDRGAAMGMALRSLRWARSPGEVAESFRRFVRPRRPGS